MAWPPMDDLDVGAAVLSLADRVREAGLLVQGFRSRRLRTSAGSVRVLAARGSGPIPAVVALHGLASAAVDLGPILVRLRRIAAVVAAPDLPGHGDSPLAHDQRCVAAIKTGLDEALEHLPRPVVLFGNSLGGLVAIRYAAAHPDRVAGLVLASPAGAACSPAERRELVHRFRLDLGSMPSDLVNLVFPSGLAFRRPLYSWGVGVRLRRRSIRSLLTEMEQEEALLPTDLAGLRMPVLLLWGERDRLLPRSHLAFFRQHLPTHAVIDLMPGRGHALHLEAPDLLADRVLAFWRAMKARPSGFALP